MTPEMENKMQQFEQRLEAMGQDMGKKLESLSEGIREIKAALKGTEFSSTGGLSHQVAEQQKQIDDHEERILEIEKGKREHKGMLIGAGLLLGIQGNEVIQKIIEALSK